MNVYSILERLEKLEEFDNKEFTFKERLESLENDIVEIKKTIGIL